MLASEKPNLFNRDMDTTTPRTSRAPSGPAGLGPQGQIDALAPVATGAAADQNDWQPAGIVNQMLAYSDWWNLPSTRRRGPRASGRRTQGS